MPRLDTESLALTSRDPLTFGATTSSTTTRRRTTRGGTTRGGTTVHEPVTLLPISRMQHQYYNVYWIT
jgi:hypothetical protein